MNNDHNKSSDHQYLERLEFNPELRKSWLNFFVTNFRVVVLLIVLLTAWGLYSYKELPLESNPEVKIPIAVVITSYPGASPADVEELVTKKIETSIAGLKDISRITSSSANSISSVTVEYDAKADLDDSIRKLRDQVKNVEKDLPADAEQPIVQEISLDDQPIFSIALAGPYDGFTLRQAAEDIQDELEKIPGVREVRVSGGDQKEFEIAYDPEKLVLYGISPAEANQLVASTNVAIPSGNFEGREYNYAVRTDSRFFDAASLAQVPVLHSPDNAMVQLGDLATIREKAIERSVYSRFSKEAAVPQNSVTIQVVKKTGGSIVATADASKARIDEMLKIMPAGLHYDTTIDMADLIRKDFGQLVHDFFLTIMLVFGILFLIVGLKEALVASLAIPLVFFATFGVMLYTGISLNFLSMVSLILALGLLVDDAIVVVSATKQYLKTGKFTPEEAVLLVLNDFKVVLTTTTLTTVWAFLPLLFSTGIMGEYIRSIPITVTVTLIASLFIALIINHPLAAVLERIRFTKPLFFLSVLAVAGLAFGSLLMPNIYLKGVSLFITLTMLGIWMKWYWYRGGKEKLQFNARLVQEEWGSDELIKKKLGNQASHENASFSSRLVHGIINFNRVLPIYERFLRRALASRKSRFSVLGAVAVLFIGAIMMPISGIVKSEFFPATDSNLVFINIEAPIGLRLQQTDQVVQQVEKKLLDRPEIINFSTLVGTGGSGDGFSSGAGNTSHMASITIKLTDPEEREKKSYEITEEIRQDMKEVQGAVVTVKSESGGPPVGSPFEARIKGDDLQVLDKIANDLKPMLASISGVVDPAVSLKESPADYTFALDPTKVELYSLNAAQVGSTIRMAISGTEVTKVLREGDEIKVMARFDQEKIPSLEALQNLQILNLRKEAVFLKDVAAISLVPSVDKITRIDQKRTVLLSANVAGQTRPNAVLAEFQKKLQEEYKLPDGYEIVYGGENEENQESMQSIMRAMIIALLLIISTLIIQFNSVRKSLIVLIAIPLALIGVFFGLALTGINLSFPGLIGVVALFGIVVKNSIILVDKINLNIKSGIEFKEAVIDAGKSRLEAIFITSICTIAGMAPVTISNETWMALGSAVIFGLLLSSFFTLFVVPVLFITWVKPSKAV